MDQEIKGEFEETKEFLPIAEDFYEIEDTYKPDLDNISDLVNERLLKYVKWTDDERGWIRIKEEAFKTGEHKTLAAIIEQKFRDSFAGHLLQNLNYQQPVCYFLKSIKLSQMRHDIMLNEFPNSLKRLNYYMDDMIEILQKCVQKKPEGSIYINDIISQTPLLRFTHCQISLVDKCLQSYNNLQALILASNYISDFPGINLPRSLKMLELYGNILESIEELCNDPPSLLYLGIGRNYLNSNSGMINILLLNNLCHLDLSDNDFIYADGLLEIFSKFLRLESLQLIGNPCSLTRNYKRKVQISLPTLIFLDGERLDKLPLFLKENKQRRKDALDYLRLDNDALLEVHSFRITGNFPKELRGHKKQEAVEYRLELELPLLDWGLNELVLQSILSGEIIEESVPDLSYLIPPLIPVEIPEEEESEKPAHKKFRKSLTAGKKDKKKMRDTKKKESKGRNEVNEEKRRKWSRNSSKEGNRKANKLKEFREIEEKYLAYLSRDKMFPVEPQYKSPAMKWIKTLVFKNPCIEVRVPSHMLTKLRDTFRSTVTLRLVQIEPTKKGNKSEAPDKGKKKTGKSKKNEKGKKNGKDKKSGKDMENEDILNQNEEQSIRNTIAKICVPLEMIKWNQQHLGYTWDLKHCCEARVFPDIQKVKFKTEGGTAVDDVKKTISKSKKKLPKSKRALKDTGKTVSDEKVYELPPCLTCHFGIGLKRDNQFNENYYKYKAGTTVKTKMKTPRNTTAKSINNRIRMEETLLAIAEKINENNF